MESGDTTARLNIVGTEVEVPEPVEHAGHDRPFAIVVGLDDLRHSIVNDLSRKQLAALAAGLLDRCDAKPDTGTTVQIFLYLRIATWAGGRLDVDDIGGFSLLRANGSRLSLAYFESIGDRFRYLTDISGVLDGTLAADDARLLHFAALRERPLPKRSTILELNSGAWAKRRYSSARNTRLRWSVLADTGRSYGAKSLGLSSPTLFRMVAGSDDEHCSSDTACPSGEDSCNFPPGGPDKECNLPPPQGDILVDFERAILKADSSRPSPIDWVLVRKAIDQLDTTEMGVRVLSAWYRLGLFLQTDAEILAVIERLIPSLHNLLRRIVDGQDTDVLVDDELPRTMRVLIAAHRNVPNEALQRLLAEIDIASSGWGKVTRGELLGTTITH
jgi:hypothetical protein